MSDNEQVLNWRFEVAQKLSTLEGKVASITHQLEDNGQLGLITVVKNHIAVYNEREAQKEKDEELKRENDNRFRWIIGTLVAVLTLIVAIAAVVEELPKVKSMLQSSYTVYASKQPTETAGGIYR